MMQCLAFALRLGLSKVYYRLVPALHLMHSHQSLQLSPSPTLQETAARAEQAADSPSKVAGKAAAVGAHEALLAQVWLRLILGGMAH